MLASIRKRTPFWRQCSREAHLVRREIDMSDLIAIARAMFLSSLKEDDFVPKYRYGHESYQDVLEALRRNQNANAQPAIAKP